MTERLGEHATFEDAARAHQSDDHQYIQHDGESWVLFRTDAETWARMFG